ncbi:hypothetical protein Tco_0678989 [Tanacetum coccineum]|uniref:Uncharacterized protein n=1 Tax=Tanacetum coccineum TaxID=301880 RepID=A0ABQ4XGL5_9ASTR
MCFNSSIGLYSFQLVEKWFNLHKDILRDALNITLANDNNPFAAPPSSDTVIEYFNTLGYPSTLKNVSTIVANATQGHSTKAGKAPTQPSKAVSEKKRKLVKETPDEPLSATRSKGGLVMKKRKPKSPLKLVDRPSNKGVPGPAHPVVIREPESGRIQPLPEVQRKGKEKRRTPTTTEPFGHTESPSLYAKLGLTDSETESDEEVSPEINAGTQDEGQVGSNPGDAAKSQPQSSHVVYTGPNLEHMDFEENLKLPTEDQVILEEPASSAGTLSSLQNLDKELSFTNQFLVEKSQEDEPDKSNTKAKVQSMVTVPIHQDTSSVPLMTTPVIDLTMSQPVSTTVQAPLPTSTAIVTSITTTASLTPPLPQPQQSIADLILICRIRELEQHMADLLQSNLALEERLDKHGSRLYKLENLNIPHQVNKALDEVVTDVVDWAMQAPLRARFSDLPTIDMKEILHQRMFKDNSYESHEESSANVAHGVVIFRTASGRMPLASSYEPPAKNSLLAKTGDMTTFLNWYCRQINKSKLTQSNLEGQAYEVFKVFYPDIIHLQFQMEECHKMLTDQVDWANPKGDQVRINVLQKFYIDRHDSPSRRKEVRTHMRILSVVRIKAYSRYGYDYLSEIVLRRADHQEHKIAEKDFKNLYPSDFEDLNFSCCKRVEDFQLGIESCQTQLNLTKPGWDATGYEFKHHYTIIESPRASFWTEKDVTRSKEFITAIERRLKTRRIYRNLECFVGGRVRDIDYRLLQRTE